MYFNEILFKMIMLHFVLDFTYLSCTEEYNFLDSGLAK